LVADGDGLRFPTHRRKRRPQHAAPDIAIPNVDLDFVQPAATLREGLTLEVFPDGMIPRHESYPALADERQAKMDGDIGGFT